jgi:DNA mismatch repair protein MutS
LINTYGFSFELNKTKTFKNLDYLYKLYKSQDSFKKSNDSLTFEELLLNFLKLFKKPIDEPNLRDELYNKTYIKLFINAIEQIRNYNYCKPIIQLNDNSFVKMKGLRHVLIEHLEKNELYVTNDIELGTDTVQGILLFGTNAVGKTSLIKSIGTCIIMAQSGLYVPCSSMVYYPYEYIFTRIIGNDNIFKGLSTFGVEMSELRVILQKCNKNSLILGDELCSGTEIDSALSIFTAGLETMYERKSSFIFATHL